MRVEVARKRCLDDTTNSTTEEALIPNAAKAKTLPSDGQRFMQTKDYGVTTISPANSVHGV